MTCHRIGSKASHSRPCVADWARQDRNDACDPVYRRLDRSLVLVLSDALRRQVAKKPGDRRDVNRSRDGRTEVLVGWLDVSGSLPASRLVGTDRISMSAFDHALTKRSG